MSANRDDRFIQGANGQAQADAQVYYLVNQPNATTALVDLTQLLTIYTSSSASITATNPVSTDNFGHAFAYLVNSPFTVAVVLPTGTVYQVLPDQQVPSGSPSFPDQDANTVFAGPTSGSAATPGFRSLVVADLPTTGTWGFDGTFNGTPSFTGTLTISGLVSDSATTTFSGVLNSSGGTISGTWLGTPTLSQGATFNGTVTSSGATLAGNFAGTPSFTGTVGFSNVPTFPAQAAGTVFAGPTTGAAATPSFRALVVTDFTVPWSSLGNASGNLTLANAGFNTTFNQTSAATWTWANVSAASSFSAQQNSPIITLAGTYWTGSASGTDSWTIQNVLSTNAPPTESMSALTFTHSGTPTLAQCQFPGGGVIGGVYYPGISFTSDPNSGLFDYGSSQIAIVAGGIPVMIVGTSDEGDVTLTANAPIAGAGAQGFLYFPVIGSGQAAVSFNIPPGYPGGSMTGALMTQVYTQPSTASWGLEQAGLTWCLIEGSPPTGMLYFWNGSAIQQILTM